MSQEKIGYARTSTIDQIAGLEAQIVALEKEGCTKVFHEQVSSVAQRDQLLAALEYVREGDIFIVTKLDRLARSTADLLSIAEKLEKKKVSLRIINLGIDTSTPTGKLLLTTLGAIAQFEREIMLERQREGISKAKAEGKFKGRKPISNEIHEEVMKLSSTRITRRDLAKKLGIGEATVYRILNSRKPVSIR